MLLTNGETPHVFFLSFHFIREIYLNYMSSLSRKISSDVQHPYQWKRIRFFFIFLVVFFVSFLLFNQYLSRILLSLIHNFTIFHFVSTSIVLVNLVIYSTTCCMIFFEFFVENNKIKRLDWKMIEQQNDFHNETRSVHKILLLPWIKSIFCFFVLGILRAECDKRNIYRTNPST